MTTNSSGDPEYYDENKIEEILQKHFPNSIRKWLRKNDPELFLILVSKLLPKCKEQLLLQEKIKHKEQELAKFKKDLQNAEIEVSAKESELRFWERDNVISIGPISIRPWSFLNSLFDWILKMGLSVVPILSLFSIFTISNLNDLQDSLGLRISLFCGISLVWLTSATVSNWIISKTDSNHANATYSNPQPNQNNTFKFWGREFSIPKIPNFIVSIIKSDSFLFFLILFLEALIGYATVPPLIDLARANQIDPNTGVPLALPPLTIEQKFEILFGVSIFAFINILYSISKGRLYRFNTKKKKALGAALAKKYTSKRLIEEVLNELKVLKEENEKFEQLLKPNNLIGKFHTRSDDLSVLAMQGKEVDIPPDEEEPVN